MTTATRAGRLRARGSETAALDAACRVGSSLIVTRMREGEMDQVARCPSLARARARVGQVTTHGRLGTVATR